MTKILLLSYVKKMTSTKGPNKWIRALTGVSFVLLAFVTVFVSFTYFTTSFRSDKQKDRVQRVSVSCSYNQSALRQMENRLQDTGLPPEERAVLKGIFWCVTFIDSDEHFHSIFTDYVTMLYELTLNTDSSYVRGIAFKLAQDAFKRATDRLVAIFPYPRP